MAEKEAKIISPEGTPITPEDAVKLARDPTDIFNDLDKLRVESKITVEHRKILSSCECRKPDGNLYFRSCPDVNMRLTASLIRHKQERDLFFFVTPDMRQHPHVERALRYYTLVLIQTWPIGEYQLWPVPMLSDKPMPSDKSQNVAFEKSLRFWTQMTWDAGLRDYNSETGFCWPHHRQRQPRICPAATRHLCLARGTISSTSGTSISNTVLIGTNCQTCSRCTCSSIDPARNLLSGGTNCSLQPAFLS